MTSGRRTYGTPYRGGGQVHQKSIERGPSDIDRPPLGNDLDYWQLREQWERIGREVQADVKARRATGINPPGADRRLAIFRSLGKRLDRRAR